MTSAALELQGAVIARLQADSTLAALVGERIYDQVPAAADLPYVSLGPEQTVSVDAECIIGLEIFLQIDAWSGAIGRPQVKEIAEAIRAALHGADLVLTNNAFVLIEHRQTRFMAGDEQGQTKHGAVEFLAFVEQED